MYPMLQVTRPAKATEVSIVVHSSYIKESVIKRLKETIQKVIPERF